MNGKATPESEIISRDNEVLNLLREGVRYPIDVSRATNRGYSITSKSLNRLVRAKKVKRASDMHGRPRFIPVQ